MKIPELEYLGQKTLSVKTDGDLDRLISRIKDSKLVCLGDASHGTHEFYLWRMRITMNLIRNYGFQFVSFEGDWPSFEGINNFITGKTEESVEQLLEMNFRRWPSWMWANHEMQEFINELRHHNLSVPPNKRVRFHGLDLYSIYESAEKIPILLEQLDPALAKQVMNRLADVDQSANVLKLIDHIKPQSNPEKQWLVFDARQNAKVVRNGLRFSQATGLADDRPWNIRDHHMMETLNTLYDYYGPQSRGIVWAHINHVSDTRKDGKKSSITLGGLAKESFGEKAVSLVAFLTNSGTVMASPRWEGPSKILEVPPAMADSIEAAFNLISQKRKVSNLLLIFDEHSRQTTLADPIPYRYIAVVYNPNEEREANYVIGSLPERFDALFYIDETRALEPMIGPTEHIPLQSERH
ncbi:MAG: erythromycin esterase family protein [Bdellovibrio sp.]